MEKSINDNDISILKKQTGGNNLNVDNTNGNSNNKFALFPPLLQIANRDEKQLIEIFKVRKVAKKGMSTNERILVVSETYFTYYNIPPKKGKTENFIRILEKIYNPKRINVSNNKSEDEEKEFTFLRNEFIENSSHFIKKDEFLYDKTEIITELEEKEKENPKGWRYCVIIRQKNQDGKKNREPEIYANLNNEDKDKSSNDKKKVQWIMNFFEANFVDRVKKLYEEIKKKKNGNLIKEIIQAKQPEQQKNNSKIIKKEEEPLKKEEKSKNNTESIPEVDPEIVQTMYYNEICYQYLLKQYYNVCNHNDSQTKNKQRMKYEFSILQLTTKFKEICQTISKKIVADLYAQPFQKSNPHSYSLHPILFPYPTKLKKSDQAVFLYYIRGINFTLTWHQTVFKMRSEQKFEFEEIILNGAWNNLNIEFKNRDFFTDLMIGLCREFPSRLDLPRYPISCIVDYCGFRILCESDIYVDDGYKILRRMEALSSQIDPDPNYSFYKEIASLVSNEKEMNSSNQNSSSSSSQNPNIKGDKDQAQPIADILVTVSYQGKEDRQQYNKGGFQQVIKYHSKQFKEIDNVIFSNKELENLIIPKMDKIENKDFTINYGNVNIDNDLSGLIKESGLKETSNNLTTLVGDNTVNDEIKAIRNKLNDFFDLSSVQSQTNIYLKDMKESVKYIMDIKVLKKLKDKSNDTNIHSSKKQNLNNNLTDNSNSTMPIRSIYFRPEFIVKYLKDNGFVKQNLNEREIDTNEMFLKILKKYLYLEDTGTPQYKLLIETSRYFKENHINYFANCLDTMHFKPYDSETLTETFHRYGVNMFYLGLVAEITGVPHIRELCQIEMISRICKKMLFDIIALKIIKKANDDYYTGTNDHLKTGIDYDYSGNSSESYLQFVPVTFFVRYWKDYLKKLHILGTESFKCSYIDESNKNTNLYVKGLYRRNWHKCTNSHDNQINNIFQSKDEKTASKNNKENNENNMLAEAKKEIVQFLNVLFNFDNSLTLKFLNIKDELNNKSLWDIIFERVKSHYSIENYKDVFAYCDPMYISLPALFSSIQYHTGISVNFSVPTNTKYNNKDLINFNFSEEMIEIKPRTKVYSYRYFLVNRDKFDTIRNDYSFDVDEVLYKKVLLRYFTEKFQKNITTYTMSYFHYMNAMKRMENNNQIDSLVEWITKNDLDLKDKIKSEADYMEFYRLQYSLLSSKFESFNYLFLLIIESFTYLYSRENMNLYSYNTTRMSSKNNMLGINTFDINSTHDYISEFWFSKHPFLSLLYILLARLYLKTFKLHDEKSEGFFKKALEIAKDSLGTNNIFVANLCEEIGYCYIKSKKYYEGIKHYNIANSVFKDNKEEFYECYMKLLKKITKYYIILGYYRNGLESGHELVSYYMISNGKKRLEDYNIEAIIFNLILICSSLGEYSGGAEFCKILLYDLQPGSKLDIKFTIKHFRDWRKKNTRKISYTNENNENNYDEKHGRRHMIDIIKIYIKLIIKNLKDTDKNIYIEALVKLIEDKQERESLKSMGDDQQKLFETFFPHIKDESELGKFFYKMLTHIGAKLDIEKSYLKANDIISTDIDKNYNENWAKFKTLYKIFEKNKFFNIMDKDIYLAYTK